MVTTFISVVVEYVNLVTAIRDSLFLFFLVMYGTGFRFRNSNSGVTVKVGGRTLQSLYSGVAAGFVGLDQLNISALPRDLTGVGVVNIEITVDGKVANTTTVSIK